jgi:hypothetical protein
MSNTTSDLKPIKGKCIYTTKGAAREYGRIGCNFFKGCPHECEYCYLKRGAPSAELGGNTAVLKKCLVNEDKALEIFCKEARKHIEVLKKYGVFLSFSTDPMLTETRDLTFSAINFCISNDIHVKVLTKNADFILYDRMKNLCGSTVARDYVEFGFTLTGRDDMEPKASSNHDRIEAMRLLYQRGFKTFASIEPVIDWTHSKMVIDLSIDCCNHYKIGLRSGVKKDYYDVLRSGMAIEEMVNKIVSAGRTVYLKESTRALLRRCYIEDYSERILSKTLDIDSNPYKTIQEDE